MRQISNSSSVFGSFRSRCKYLLYKILILVIRSSTYYSSFRVHYEKTFKGRVEKRKQRNVFTMLIFSFVCKSKCFVAFKKFLFLVESNVEIWKKTKKLWVWNYEKIRLINLLYYRFVQYQAWVLARLPIHYTFSNQLEK